MADQTNIPALHYVPAEPRRLLGRERELDQLDQLLSDAQRQGMTATVLNGPGGIGKTSLAAFYARTRARQFRGGIFWLALADGGPDAIIGQLETFAQECGIGAETIGSEKRREASLAERWLADYGSRPDILLVLDDLEEPNLLTEPLPGLPPYRLREFRCRKLITSRRGDFPFCNHLQLTGLPIEAARALLVDTPRRREANAAAGAEGLDDLIRLLGGSPLQLQLAGELLASHPDTSYARLAEEILSRGAREVLEAGQVPTSAPRHSPLGPEAFVRVMQVQSPDGAISSGIALTSSHVLTVAAASGERQIFLLRPASAGEPESRWRRALPVWQMTAMADTGQRRLILLQLEIEADELGVPATPPRFAHPRRGAAASVYSITPTGGTAGVLADIVSVGQTVRLEPRHIPIGSLLSGGAVLTEDGLAATLIVGSYLEAIALERLSADPAFREALGLPNAITAETEAMFPALLGAGPGIALTAVAAALLIGFTILSLATVLAPSRPQPGVPPAVQAPAAQFKK